VGRRGGSAATDGGEEGDRVPFAQLRVRSVEESDVAAVDECVEVAVLKTGLELLSELGSAGSKLGEERAEGRERAEVDVDRRCAEILAETTEYLHCDLDSRGASVGRSLLHGERIDIRRGSEMQRRAAGGERMLRLPVWDAAL